MVPARSNENNLRKPRRQKKDNKYVFKKTQISSNKIFKIETKFGFFAILHILCIQEKISDTLQSVYSVDVYITLNY